MFGGLTKAGDLIMNPIKRSMEKNMLKVYAGKTKLLFSQLKESDAAVLGASALGWEVKRPKRWFGSLKSGFTYNEKTFAK